QNGNSFPALKSLNVLTLPHSHVLRLFWTYFENCSFEVLSFQSILIESDLEYLLRLPDVNFVGLKEIHYAMGARDPEFTSSMFVSADMLSILKQSVNLLHLNLVIDGTFTLTDDELAALLSACPQLRSLN